MYSPIKAREELICKYCGKVIPVGTYYERYRQNNYHIQCIWDSLLNDKQQDSLENATKFFLSLQKYIGNWPAYDFDTEDDYVKDLEIYKHNLRITSKQESLILNKEVNKMTSVQKLNEKFASMFSINEEAKDLEALTKRFNKVKSKVASYVKDIQADDIAKLDGVIKAIKDLRSAGEHIVDSRHDNDANKIERQVKKANDRLDAIEDYLK